VILVAPDQAAKVLQPGEQPLDAPPPPVAAQGAAVLGRRAAPVRSVRGDQLNPALGGQARIQGVTVVGFVSDRTSVRGRSELLRTTIRSGARSRCGAKWWSTKMAIGRSTR